MESTSEVVWKEQSQSSVSKKCVQEVSTTSSVQKLSSSAVVGEKSVLSILGNDGDLMTSDGNMMISPGVKSSMILTSPIITSPSLPEEGDAINTTSLQSEFSTMKLKDEQGNEIGEMIQQKQQQQSVQATSSVTAIDSSSSKIAASVKQVSSSSSSSVLQQSDTSLVSQAQDTTSAPCTVDDKSVCVEELPENTKTEKQSVEEDVTTTTITLKKHVDEDKTNVADKAVEKSVEQSESEEIEEVVEEIEESGDDENLAEDVNQKITEEVDDTPDGGQTKTITTTTVKEEQPNSITKTVVTSTIVTKETPTTTTTITEIPPTTEEIKVQTTKIVETSSKEVALEEKKSEKNEGDENDKVEQQDEEDEEDEEFEEEEEEEEEEKVEDKEENVKQEDNKKFVKDESSQQQLNNDQTPQEAESKPTQQEAHINKQTVVDAPSVAPPKDQHETNKQENLNNTIKNIISSIDSNIQAEENIAALKERELELLKKQQELAKEIEQQKLLAQKLASENQLKQQFNNNFTHRESSIPLQSYQPTKNVSKYSTFEENQDENVYSRKSETFETMESTNVSKKIDLHKIFTPATDAAEILPKNRKLYASSAFYSPSLHPTVEDQVELARRISHSLSDISNQQSRGQSMYVNRKKRSVKWVHEGCGQETDDLTILNQEEYNQEEKENNNVSHHEKVPLKFLMNPSGQMRDINSLRESINTETGLLSPDVSAEVVTALQAQKGKDYHQYQQQPRPSTSPSILPAYTDAAKHRVQLNLHQEQLLEKYAKPGLKVVQTPWEAALNSGSASAAFVEEQKLSPYSGSVLTPSPTPQLYDASQGGAPLQSSPTAHDRYSKPYSSADGYQKYPTQTATLQQAQHERQQYTGTNLQRELAYKPSIPQGWKAPSMSLPKDYEQRSYNETNLTANEIKRVQQQHISTVNEAAKSCEEFNTADETELIDLICKNATEKSSSCFTATTQSSKHMPSAEAKHHFGNHLSKSSELRVSPIPISTQVAYDNTVQELHMKQLKSFNQLETKNKNCDSQPDDVSEKAEKVNVRKQLEQFEDLHRQFAKQIEQDELLQKKRETAKLKALQHNISNSNKCNINSNETNESSKYNTQQIYEQQPDNEEEYVKVPVKKLITNFEQQCLQDEKLSTQLAHSSSASASTTILKDRKSLETKHQIQTNEITESYNEDLYMPKEIPLQSYAPPPVAAIPFPAPSFSTNTDYETNQNNSYKPLSASPLEPYSLPEYTPTMNKPYGGGSNTFPISKPNQQGFSLTYGHQSNQPPKQQYLPPQSYQKIPQNTSQNIPQVSFNPSPLPYDKLAKFENPPSDEGRYINSPTSRGSNLNVRGSRVRNTSPAPFAGSYNRAYTPSCDAHHYGDTPSTSPRPLSSMQQNSGYNSPHLSHPSVSSTQILNAPSYNTSARGWGHNGGASTGYKYPQSQILATRPQIVNAASMPYTDF